MKRRGQKILDALESLRRRGYQIGKLLGAGGFGEVYEILEKDQRWAAKIIADATEATMEEIRVQDRLSHACITSIKDWWMEEGVVVIVMELAPHGDVLDWMGRRKCLPEESVWNITECISSALAHLHHQDVSVLHRDIKPENILVFGEDLFKLSDFGLSKQVTAWQPAVTKCGTESHWAPELLCLSLRPYGPAVDAWALGVTLYELAAGFHPFEDERGNIFAEAIVRAAPNPFPPSISIELHSIISALLKKDPAERLTIAALCQHSRVQLISTRKEVRDIKERLSKINLGLLSPPESPVVPQIPLQHEQGSASKRLTVYYDAAGEQDGEGAEFEGAEIEKARRNAAKEQQPAATRPLANSTAEHDEQNANVEPGDAEKAGRDASPPKYQSKRSEEVKRQGKTAKAAGAMAVLPAVRKAALANNGDFTRKDVITFTTVNPRTLTSYFQELARLRIIKRTGKIGWNLQENWR